MTNFILSLLFCLNYFARLNLSVIISVSEDQEQLLPDSHAIISRHTKTILISAGNIQKNPSNLKLFDSLGDKGSFL